MAKSLIKVQGDAANNTSFEVVASGTSLVQKANGTQSSHIADPTGGVTTDAEARTAIDAILVVLETYGLTASS